MKKHNFYAGPAILPDEVLEQSAAAIQELGNSGLSLITISHRSKEFIAVLEEAQQLVKELYDLSDDYAVLFLQGGASTQFCMVPYNLLAKDATAAYLDTGSWSSKAIKEATLFGNVNVIASSSDKNYNYIPKDFEVPSDSAYLHITTNNTIYGTEINDLALFGPAYNNNVPIVADMSSDIFSGPLDANKLSLIYAGAQKNLGPAGTTLVIIKKELAGKSNRQIPSMLDYNVHISKNSVYNTAPVFAIYASMLTLRWIKNNGGLQGMAERNRKKYEKLYQEIDRNGLFKGTASREDRSRMNVTFVLKDDSLNEQFLAVCDDAQIVGIKGHRSVGGFRASIYNALPQESLDVLVEVMREFEKKNG